MANTVAAVEVNDDCTTKAMDATDANDLDNTNSSYENFMYYEGYKKGCEAN